MNAYVFSSNTISFEAETKHQISKNAYLKLSEIENHPNITLTCANYGIKSICELNLSKLQNNHLAKVSDINNQKYIEIISINHNIISKHNTKNCQIEIYADHITIFHQTNLFSYYFVNDKNNYAIEYNNNIYVFNKNNLLKFDMENLSFCLYNCSKFEKKGNKIEILCKIPYVDCYFLLFAINSESNIVTIKHYKQGDISITKYSLPFVFFELIKAGIEDAKKYVTENINFESIKKYFSKYNHLLEIENKYYLCGNTIDNVYFNIENNIIIDID